MGEDVKQQEGRFKFIQESPRRTGDESNTFDCPWNFFFFRIRILTELKSRLDFLHPFSDIIIVDFSYNVG